VIGRPGRISLRARLMLLGVTGVAVALAIGSTVLYAVLVVAIERTVDSSARATASDVVSMAEAGTLPDPLPVSGAQVVQVVGAAGPGGAAPRHAPPRRSTRTASPPCCARASWLGPGTVRR
jgi:hypothetical protein